MPRKSANDQLIEQQYDAGEHRLIQERLDFLLPQIKQFVEDQKWVNLHPEYQRRLVWDNQKKSLFIESLLMNIPIPPVFLFESDLNRYEVMDGQQRLNAVLQFYKDDFALSGLESWSILNGKRYGDFPERVRRGLDRRKISAIVLATETDAGHKAAFKDIRRQVFERLNTGGQHLNAQELRNCLYSRDFNELLIELSCHPEFTRAWGIPPHKYARNRRQTLPKELAENKLFRRMQDCEIVLRFLAFRHTSKIKGSVRSILDTCMDEHETLTPELAAEYRRMFPERLRMARAIFGAEVFRIEDENGRWNQSIPLYDGVMVAIDRLWENRTLIRKRAARIAATLARELQRPSVYEIVVGKPNTAQAIKDRLDLITRAFTRHVS